MREYLILTKALFKMQFIPGKNNVGDAQSRQRVRMQTYNIIGMLVFGVIMTVYLAIFMFNIGPIIKQADFVAEMSAMLMTIAFLVSFFIGLAQMLSYVYFSKDNEAVMALPIKPSSIFMARLSIVYFTTFMISTVIILPGLLFLGIAAGEIALFYLMIPFAMVLVPLFTLMFTALLSLPLIYIMSKVRRRGIFTVAIVAIGIAILTAAYLFLVLGSPTFFDAVVTDPYALIVLQLKSACTTVANIGYPFYAFGRFMTASIGLTAALPSSMLIDLAIFLLSVGLVTAISLILSTKIYDKSALRLAETPKIEKKRGKIKEFEAISPLKALVKKEWSELIRNKAFGIQSVMVSVIPLIMVIFMSVMFLVTTQGNSITELNEITGENIIIHNPAIFSMIIAQFMIMFMPTAMNFSAMTAISRENRNYEISKAIPIPYHLQIKAKKIVSLILSWTGIILSAIAVLIFQIVQGIYNPLPVLLFLAMCLMYDYGFTCFLIRRDLKNPDLFWSNPQEVIKSKGRIFPIMLSMVASMVIMIVAMVVLFSAGKFYFLALCLMYATVAVIAFVFAIFMHRWLEKDTNILYFYLGESD